MPLTKLRQNSLRNWQSSPTTFGMEGFGLVERHIYHGLVRMSSDRVTNRRDMYLLFGRAIACKHNHSIRILQALQHIRHWCGRPVCVSDHTPFEVCPRRKGGVARMPHVSQADPTALDPALHMCTILLTYFLGKKPFVLVIEHAEVYRGVPVFQLIWGKISPHKFILCYDYAIASGAATIECGEHEVMHHCKQQQATTHEVGHLRLWMTLLLLCCLADK